MKYIIDLPDNCSWVQWIMTSDKDGHAYFDFKNPEDLTPLDKKLEEAFQKGHDAAWVNVGECEDRVANRPIRRGLTMRGSAQEGSYGKRVLTKQKIWDS